MLKTLGRRIWIDEIQWNRIGMFANDYCIMSLQFLVDIVMEAIDHVGNGISRRTLSSQSVH